MTNVHDHRELLELIARFEETVLKRGLSEDELGEVEWRFGFVFPPDLRSLLAEALPTGPSWPDWREALSRDSAEEEVRERLDWPLDGMLFDIQHDSFWDPEWGAKPSALEDAFAIARRAVKAAPVMIPIYSHRYLPAEPCLAGSPVFSIHQTDIIIYGSDLGKYFAAECSSWRQDLVDQVRQIRCWTRWMHQPWTPSE